MNDLWLLILVHSLSNREFQRLAYLHTCITKNLPAPDWAKL